MTLANLMLFFAACFGLTKILVDGRIFDPIRPNIAFFHCPMCIGFWVGVLVLTWFHEAGLAPLSVAMFYICACASSGVSYLLSVVVNDFGVKVFPTRLTTNLEGAYDELLDNH